MMRAADLNRYTPTVCDLAGDNSPHRAPYDHASDGLLLEKKTVTLEDLWKLTRRYWVLLLACTCIGLALAAGFTWTRQAQYTASSKAFVVGISDGNTSGSAYSAGIVAQQKAAAWESVVTSQKVAERVIDKLHLQETPTELAQTITAKAPEDMPVITVTATAKTPQDAQNIANAVVDATAAEVKKLEPNSGAKIKSIVNAQLPTAPSYPRPERILPIGAIAGLLIGYLLSLIRHRQDTRIRSGDDVEEHLGASVLGVIPDSKAIGSSNRSPARVNSEFQTREALRQLRTNLRFVDVDHDPRSIVITSARMGEGKSTVSSSLAWVLADSGDPVVLIDADLRRPRMADVFDLDGSVGLTQVLAGTVSLADALQPTDKAGLYVLTAGQVPPNPSELLGSQRMHQLIDKLRETHRIILDAPPLLPVTDAALLTASADGAVVVVAASDTREEHIKHAAANLSAVGGRVLGAVLNRVNTKRFNRIVYGETQYGYGAYGTYGSTYYGSGSGADEVPDTAEGAEDAVVDAGAKAGTPASRAQRRRR